MLLFYGRRHASVHKSDHSQPCWSCKDFDLNVQIQIQYFHLYFIPVVPVGKDVFIRCSKCGANQDKPDLRSAYKKNTKAPFYLYSLLILFGLIISWAVVANINTQNEKAKFVEDPMIGDVYRLRSSKDGKTYYHFMKINSISNDTISVLGNTLGYSRLVSGLDSEDYFMAEVETRYTKKQLKEMLESDEINSIERNYGSGSGFDRIK